MNRLWGAERIRGELLKLGISVGKRTVQRYMYRDRTAGPRDGQSWKTFLKNHTVWACDFLQLYDVWFTAPSVLPRFARAVVLRGLRPVPGLRPLRHRPVFAFFIVDVNAKHVVHVGVTRAPTEQRTAQQLREATPFGQGPQGLIRDRDTKYGTLLDRVAEGADIEVVLTAPCTPRMSSVVERLLGGVTRECLDHIIILSGDRLRCVLDEYARSYFDGQRPYQGLLQRIPLGKATYCSNLTGSVVAIPVLNGLHHHYQRAA